ncbi:WAT1-related protein At2g37460-like [Malus domestica]|uniref:WAT1-related protein At2g37460-like n=1 Tax=Malus domestica TaxID=3750 RepID=UPI0004989A3C
MDEPTSGLWVWDFNTFCWVFVGICASLVQYLGTTLTKKTDAVFVSSFTPISMILVIGLSTMIFHDRTKKTEYWGVIMIVIGLSIFHWGEYRSTSKEEERLRLRLNLRRRFELMRGGTCAEGGAFCMNCSLPP